MKTTRIAIIGAMEEETREIEQFLTHVEKIEGKAGLAFMEGEYGGLSVIAVRCGIGKVNAALCTQIVLDLYDPELVINVGVAGGDRAGTSCWRCGHIRQGAATRCGYLGLWRSKGSYPPHGDERIPGGP